MKQKREHSAGGAVYKKLITKNQQPTTLWLIGKHSGYHKWVLPKGMIEEGETSPEAAVREVEEETGVKATIIGEKPIHVEQYSYQAVLKKDQGSRDQDQADVPERRVAVYQENKEFDDQDHGKVLIHKTVDFYLMEYVSGDSAQHDWEMADANWYTLEEASSLLAFEGEKVALRKAAEAQVQ